MSSQEHQGARERRPSRRSSSARDSEAVPVWWPQWCRNVIIVAPRYPEVSGGARFVENFASALSAIGVSVRVFSAYPGEGTASCRTRTVIEREYLHRHPVLQGAAERHSLFAVARAIPVLLFKRLDRFRIRRRMVKAFAREAKDAVVVFTDMTAKRAFDELGLSDRIQQVQIGQHHSPFEPFESSESFATALRGAFRSVDAFTALSQKDADKVEALLGVPCFAVPNMLSPLHFSEAPSPTLVSRKAVALGRLSGEKQFEALILAFLQATDRADLRDWTLDIYGDGEERRYLEALIIDRSVGDRVRLCGVAHDISRVFTDAALHISSSRWEGFGMSVLEAAQYGVPTVAFDCSPGLHDLMVILHGVLVPPAEGVDGLASGIRELVADADSLRERGSWARDGAATYEPTRVLREWATVLQAAHSRLTAVGGSSQNGGDA